MNDPIDDPLSLEYQALKAKTWKPIDPSDINALNALGAAGIVRNTVMPKYLPRDAELDPPESPFA